MALKFSANLNFLFLENGSSLVERYALAAKAGFKGVENGIPKGVEVDNLTSALKENNLTQVLLNIITDEPEGGQFGCAALPGKESYFQENLARTIQFAKSLSCRKVHLMAGKVEGETTDVHTRTYINNLKYAANELEKIGAIGLIEPINKYAVPGYFLNDFNNALRFLKEVNKPNLKLMVDVYHLQHINGNVTKFIEENIAQIGHIQIAQVPSRCEPNSPGELDYSFVFKAIESAGYHDWVGCEYKPSNETVNGLNWINEYGYKM